MSRTMLFGAIAIAALAAVFGLRSNSRGDGPAKATAAPAESPTKPSAEATAKLPVQPVGKTAVAQALAKTADFNFTNARLADVAAFVSDHFKINVLLDSKAARGRRRNFPIRPSPNGPREYRFARPYISFWLPKISISSKATTTC